MMYVGQKNNNAFSYTRITVNCLFASRDLQRDLPRGLSKKHKHCYSVTFCILIFMQYLWSSLTDKFRDRQQQMQIIQAQIQDGRAVLVCWFPPTLSRDTDMTGNSQKRGSDLITPISRYSVCRRLAFKVVLQSRVRIYVMGFVSVLWLFFLSGFCSYGM